MSLKYMDRRRLYLANLLRRTSNKYDVAIWKAVKGWLLTPRRRRVTVNISKLNRYTSEGEVVIVPGKVVGSGNMSHKITVGAYSYSLTAKKKLLEAGCEVLLIEELVSRYPDGKGVKIIV